MAEGKDLVEEVTFTVHCLNGEKIIHRYKAHKTPEEANKFIEHMTDMITTAFTCKVTIMFFENPYIFYNSKNVVGVEFSAISIGEIETIIKESQKRVGFKKS